MLKAIHSLADVEEFFYHLILNEKVNFHPDENFENYVNLETKLPSYSTEEARKRNELMAACFEVCENEGADIYDIGIELLFEKSNPKTRENMESILLTVLIKDKKIKGILSPDTSRPNFRWWDEETEVTAPRADWEAEKINTSTIRNYMESFNPFQSL